MNESREFNFDEISIRSICIDILRNILVIVMAAAAAWLSVSGVQKLLYVPEYTASATLVVNASGGVGNAYSSLSVTNQMAGIFSEVFGSEILKNKIAENMGVDSIEGEISTSIIEETNLIILSVTSSDPRQTYMIINEALKNYDKVSDYLFSNAVLRVLSEPTVPYSPSNTANMGKIRKLSALGAAALCLAGIIVLSVFRFTVKNNICAERNLDGKILCSIPFESKVKDWKMFAKRKNKSLLITSPVVSMDFSEALRKTATRISHHMKRKGQKVVMVTSVFENEGKSSIAANIALALAEKGKKTVLVDTDMKKPAQYKVFDRPQTGKKWLYDFLSGKAEINDIFHFDKKTGLYTVYQNTGINNSSGTLNSEKMKYFMETCKYNFEYIILDSPPMAMASDAEVLMKNADTAVIVVRQDWADIRAVNDAADVVRKSGTDFAGFILNAFHRETLLPKSHEYGKYYRRAGEKFTEE